MTFASADFGINPQSHVERSDVIFIERVSGFDPLESFFGIAACNPIQVAERKGDGHAAIGFSGELVGSSQGVDGGVPIAEFDVHAKRRFADPSGVGQDFSRQSEVASNDIIGRSVVFVGIGGVEKECRGGFGVIFVYGPSFPTEYFGGFFAFLRLCPQCRFDI